MTMSPDSSVLASSSITDCVIVPAGTITQTIRGAVIFSVSSSSEYTPVGRSLTGHRLDGVRVVVVHDAFVPVVGHAAGDVRAHPAQADHSQLHLFQVSLLCRLLLRKPRLLPTVVTAQQRLRGLGSP